MSKSKKLSKRSAPKHSPRKPSAQGLSFVDRDLCGTSPNTEQFEPTESCMIRRRARMGGVS